MRKLSILLLCVPLIGLGQDFDWAISMGDLNQTSNVHYIESGQGVAVDVNGDVVITGYFAGSSDFDPGAGVTTLTAVDSLDIFIQKLDVNGNLIWAKSVGGTSRDISFDLVLDSYGNIYIAGIFNDIVDFDPGVSISSLTSGTSSDIFILKLDANGNFVWAKSFEGNCINLSIDNSDNLYVTGSFYGVVDFDPGTGVYNLSSQGYKDIFLLKLDVSGNFVWAKSYGGSYLDDEAIAVNADDNGYVFLTGYYSGNVDFDPLSLNGNLVSINCSDMFVLKVDALGNFVWVKSFGGNYNTCGGGEQGKAILSDNLGNVYVTGFYRDTADFDPGPGIHTLISNGQNPEIVILKLNENGDLVWVYSFGDTTPDYGCSIKKDKSGYIYVSGMFGGTIDFDPSAAVKNLSSTTYTSNFILKLDTDANFQWARHIEGASFSSYPSLAIDNNYNVFLTDEYYGTIDFDPNSGTYNQTSVDGTDIFVLKLTQTISDLNENLINKEKTLIKIIDVLGRETNLIKNTTLFYIYSDGTVEKRIILE